MGATISTEERTALRGEVERFAQRSIEPRAERPESPAPPTQFAAMLEEAEALGLAGSVEEPTGLGPWERLADDAEPDVTLETLVQLGRANAGAALAIHQRSLARAACRLAKLPRITAAPLAIAPHGSYGIGRLGIARWLAATALDHDDQAILADIYGTSGVRIATVEHGFGGVISPVRAGESIQWRVDERETLGVELCEFAHGLDELATLAITLPAAATCSSLSPSRARSVFAALTGAHQLGLVAIARGAVERGLDMARRYASERRQGGATIDRHPAVLGLLGSCRSALALVDAQLSSCARRRLDADGMVAALALRARAMPALADAANAALQVFGGIGYMRDVGAEKILRDTNHLRAIGGPLGELELIVAEWERLHEA